jgi:glycosyltransferase involved in cell wall biosynthesis
VSAAQESESEPLRVGMIADMVGHAGGIGRYTTELLVALGRRDDVRLIVAAPASAAELLQRLAGSLTTHLVIPDHGQLPTALWERYASGRQFERAGAQLVHGTKHLVPRVRLPTVLTVHDVMTITRADESGRAKRLLLPRQYRTSLEQADLLVAASAATRVRLHELDPSWESKTVVAPNGLSRHLLDAQPEPVEGLAGTRFALVVGDLAPRKNVGLLLEIWDRVAADAPDLRLVVLGNPGPHSDETAQRLVDLQSRGLAVWLRGARDGMLRWCYEHATVVLFPTLEEGFGFPVLEALTFHAPVIASTDPALVEVATGRGGVTHLDPTDRDAWRAAIAQAATARRADGTVPALPAGTTTWDEYTATLVERYRELAGRAG